LQQRQLLPLPVLLLLLLLLLLLVSRSPRVWPATDAWAVSRPSYSSSEDHCKRQAGGRAGTQLERAHEQDQHMRTQQAEAHRLQGSWPKGALGGSAAKGGSRGGL
jgi:hypothetical protein